MNTHPRSISLPLRLSGRALRHCASSTTGALLGLALAGVACMPLGPAATGSESESSGDGNDDEDLEDDDGQSGEGEGSSSGEESTSDHGSTTGSSTTLSDSGSTSTSTSGSGTSTSTTGGTTTGSTTSGADTTTGTDTTTGADTETLPGEFQPCPTDGPCKILPLGDSITEGLIGGQLGFNGGYRVELFRLALQDGHDVTFTGMSPNGPNGPDMVNGVPFPKNHEGVSGDVVTGIRDRGLRAIGTDMPHIILLHAGTNDFRVQPDGIPMRLSECVDALVAAAPNALVVVSNVIPYVSQPNSTVDSYNMTIEPMVQEKADAGAHVIFVDQHSVVPISMMPDTVHPNPEGYVLMGQRWYEAIEGYLP